MTHLLLRFFGFVMLAWVAIVLLTLAVGDMLPHEDEIVFSANLDHRDAEIYRMALKRQVSVPVTRNNDEDTQPTWSPDGQQMAFVSNRLGQYTIFLMDAEGRAVHRLTDSPQNNFSPTWSPDDRAIAYVTSRQEFARQITEVLMTDLESGLTRRMTIPYPNAISPAWSPDSQSIVFTSGPISGSSRTIYNLDMRTGEIQPFIDSHEVQTNPTWSPDGRYLLYSAYDANRGIYLWDVTRGQSILLFTPNIINIRIPSWSQDSRFIIYAPLTPFGDNTILELDVQNCLEQPDTCAPQPITHIAGVYDSPRWRPQRP